jgi:hypothetical protein
MADSSFLTNLLGKRVRIVCKDPVNCGDTPVLILREFSSLGVVGEAAAEQHFFPWTEVIEISASPSIRVGEELAMAIFADSEP